MKIDYLRRKHYNMDMFPTTGRVDMFPSTADINLINSTHVEVVSYLAYKGLES